MKGAACKPVNGWAVLFLPILLRALVPVGFMPMVGPDFSVQLVVCDGDGPMFTGTSPAKASMPMRMSMSTSTSMQMSMDMPADMAMDDAASTGAPDHHRGFEGRGTCPYGSAPALGALPKLANLPSLLLQRPLEASLATAQVAFVDVAPRAQSPRGPPV